MKAPGRLLASGRDSDIFEYGANSVLRRARSGRSMALEAQTMRYLAEHGYPVRARVLGFGRSLLTDRFFGNFDHNDVLSQLHAAATWKATDTNLSADEVAGLWRAVAAA